MTEAELLFSEIFGCDRPSLYLNSAKRIAKDKSVLISSVLERRISGEPIQYILGKTEFMGLGFMVRPQVLIPRPETEILVEAVLEYCRRKDFSGSPDIIDIGTGSGNIAVSLAKLLPSAKITAADISKEAIGIAGHNALLNEVAGKITFVCSDLFAGSELSGTIYDIIVSNPPYIAAGELKCLQPEIKHEPVIALDGGKDGLDYYRRLAKEAPSRLKEGGLLMVEIGCGQKEAITGIFGESGLEVLEVIADYNDIDRVIVAKKRR